MLFTLVQPMLFWLIFFGNLFQRAADAQVTQAPNYISFLAAGVVVMTVLNNGLAGGVDGLQLELGVGKQEGQIDAVADRLPVDPDHARADLQGQFLGDRAGLDLCDSDHL